MTVIKKLKWKAWIAFLLVFMMIGGLLPVNGFSSGNSVSAITTDDKQILIEINIYWFYDDDNKLYISTPNDTSWQELPSFSASNNYLYTLKTSDNTKIRLSRNANTPGGNYYNPSGNNYTGEIEVKAGDFLSFTDMGKGGQSFNRIKNAKIVASAEDGTKLFHESKIVKNGDKPSDTNQYQTRSYTDKYYVGQYEYTGRYITHISDFYDYKTDTEVGGTVVHTKDTMSSGYTDPYVTLNSSLQYVGGVSPAYVEFDLSSSNRYQDIFYLHMWDGRGRNLFGDFPGKKVTDFELVEGTSSVIKVPVSGYVDLKVILSSGGAQAAEHSVLAGKRYKYHDQWDNLEYVGTAATMPETVAYSNPLYFGCFYTETEADTNNGDYNSTYTDDIKPKWYSNFKWVSNLALRNDNDTSGSKDYRMRTSVTGLVGKQMKNGVGREGEIVDVNNSNLTLPYLSRTWAAEHSNLVSLTKDVQFPFYEVRLKEDRYGNTIRDNSGNHPLYYQFNSRDAVSLYLDPTTSTMYEHNGEVYSQKAVQGGSTKGFFPYNIDGSKDADGELGRFNNLAFGVKYEIPFVLTEDGKINGLDTTFEFMGDDDVWVFVDGQLVLDMGGGHKDAYGKINFNINNTSSYLEQTVDVSDNLLSTAANNIKYQVTTPFEFDEDSYIHKDATKKYRTTKVHTLTMYFMERGMWESDNFIRFNFTKQNILNVDTNVEIGDNVNKGFVKKTYEAANLDVFNYSLDNTDIQQVAGEDDTKNGLAFVGGLANASRTVSYQDGDTKITIPETTTAINKTSVSNPQIAVDNGNNNKNVAGPVSNTVFERYDRYLTNTLGDIDVPYVTGKTDSDGEFGLLYAQYASFKNQFYSDSTLEIKQLNELSRQKNLTTAEALENGKIEESKRTINKYYQTKWTLYDVNGNLLGQDQTFKTYDNGTYIMDNERDNRTAPKDKLTFQNKEKHPTVGVSLYAEYVNTPNVGTLAITKKLEDPNDEYNKEFEIKVKFTSVFGQSGIDMEETDYKGVSYSVSGDIRKMGYRDGYGIIVIKADETAVISGIPVGTMVDVTEDDHKFHEKVRITPDTSTEIVIDKETGEPGVEREVVNKRKLGELDLSKVITYKSSEVAQEDSDKDVTFPFTVTLTSTDFNIADYINTGNPGGDPSIDGITPNGWSQTNAKSISMTFNVSANAPQQIKNIPYGTSYTVTEAVTDTETWKKITGDVNGTIDSDLTTVSITNEKQKEKPKYGDLTVTKSTTGSYADTDKQFSVLVEFVNSKENISGITASGATVTVDSEHSVKVSFEVKDGSSVKISQIIYGTSYTVTETTDGEYTTTVNGTAANTVSGMIDETTPSFTAAFVNTAKPVLIKIIKQDGKGNAVSGAQFAIYETKADAEAKNNNTVVVAAVNAEGTEFTFDGLKPNTTYWIAEIVIPDNHFGIAEPVEVTTGILGTTTEQVVENPVMIEMPETGGKPFVINFAVAGLFVMVLAVGAMLVYRKRLQKSAVEFDEKGGY